jgi:hypothetical protein
LLTTPGNRIILNSKENATRYKIDEIEGIGPEFSKLPEAAGVDTVKELRNRNAENLAARKAEINGTRKLTRTLPSEKPVSSWAELAKSLDPLITH